MESPSAPALKIFDFNASAGATGTSKSAVGSPELPFNQLLAARQLSLLGGQPESFAAIQAQALSRFSQEQGNQLSAESVLAEVGMGTGQDLPGTGNALPQTLALSRLGGDVEASVELTDDALSENPGLSLNWPQMSMLNEVQKSPISANVAENAGHPAQLALATAARQSSLSFIKQSLDESGGVAEVETAAQEFARGQKVEPFANSLISQIQGRNALTQKGEQLVSDIAGDQLDSQASELDLLTGLRELRSSNSAQAARPQLMTLPQHAVTDPAWSQAFTARIGWMVSQGVKEASIQLHPEELGSIQVQLKMDGDATRVQFQAQSAETGELIERMLPRLSHGFEQQGLRLDDAKVSVMSAQQNAGGPGQNQGQAFDGSSARGGQNGDDQRQSQNDSAPIATDTLRSVVLGNPGGVDDYA